MPWQIPYVDPNTGATFPVSYVRALSQGAQPENHQASIVAARFASVTCYSLGFRPLQTVDLVVAGSAYNNSFGPQVAAAYASFNSMLASTADTYIGNLPTMSGAIQVA